MFSKKKMCGILEWAFHRRNERKAKNDDGGCAVLQDIQKASWLQDWCLTRAEMLVELMCWTVWKLVFSQASTLLIARF